MVHAALQICIAYYIISLLDPFFLSWQCLNRPIVVAPITGLILGDFHTGIIMGAALESIFMGISAIGGSIPADATTSSVIAVAYTVLTGSNVEAGLALALPIGAVMASFANIFTPLWASLAAYWEKLAVEASPKKFMIQVFGVNALMPLVNTIVLFVAVAFGVEGLNSFLAVLPHQVMAGLTAASSMMLAVGFAILTSMIWSKEVGYFFFLGYVLVKYLKLATLPIAIIGAIIAITLFLAEKRNIDLKNLMMAKAANKVEEEDFF
ncbi:PTS mannose/fructose/sorbose/N-acetylgalactosamine transporter subunit IIC [Clostridium fungisolvens]|uniref:PTS system sorbose-specific EIIC component n=1 Tax=Clostridium fungisolvens TaxID=1604897 RepID=A0A6V8SGV8_9CLOT|nr:PTS sugar transporter subunit IIC [Clostridium fungisolvens]GFP76439.1 PTS system sorbose-specific EIIC component [Clostridium fungisolvens]